MSLGVSHKTYEIPALGRNFQLGGLYDSRTDTIVAGFSLWDRTELEAPHLNVTYNNGTNYTLVASDKLGEKLENLKVNGSLQLSVLSGLVDLKGSAIFLNTKKNSHHESSVHVRCHHRTLVKSLTMDHLGKGKITHLDVAKTGANNSATHVVTSIQYGADATFTFTRRYNHTEDQKATNGELNVCAKNLMKVLNGPQTGQGDCLSTAHKSGNDANIDCKFEGDFTISQGMETPTNYEEAINFARGFGHVLSQAIVKDTASGNEPLGVPCFVTLHPLVNLPEAEAAPFLQNEISDIPTSNCVRLMENYEELEGEVQDLLNDSLGSKISPFRKQLEFFQTRFTSFRLQLKMKLREMLVHIRSGQSDVAFLEQLLERIHDERFVFSPHRIGSWLVEKHHELCIAKRFRDIFTAKQLDHNEDRLLIFPTERQSHKHMTMPAVRHAIYFVLTSMTSAEFALQLADTTMRDFGDILATALAVSYLDDDQRWHRQPNVVRDIEKELLDYIQFTKANMGEKGVVFAMTALEAYDETCARGSSIFVYENGTLSKKNYELPKIPRLINIEWLEDLQVMISFLPPAKGEILRYRITHTENLQHVSSFFNDPFYVLSRQKVLAMIDCEELDFTVTAECLYGSGPSYTASLYDETLSQ